ncbi:MAG TPA: hypothetical protein PK869_12630, partial [Candidatus Hydrogenedentes bacterium]|nr:hypothetical protein [Candidatus Hydrogenedentota bacterium]
RARQFSIGAFKQIDPIPETRVLKSHYARQAQKIVGELYTEILTKQIYVNPRIDLYFGMPRPDSLGGKTVHPIEVMYWSTNIQFGASVMRLLLDSEVGGIDDLHVWTPKEADGFKSYPVGVSMWMTMSGFCKLVEKLQNDDTMTITIQGFSIRNTALRASQDPWLKIDMTFRFDEYDYKPKPASGQAAGDAASAPGGAASGDAALSGISGNRLAQIQAMRAASARNSSGSAGGGEASKPEESFWQKLWPF